MLRIEQSYVIQALPEQVWRALTEPSLMAQWTGAPAQFVSKNGGWYNLWDGYVTGEVIEYEPPTRLIQSWQPNDWSVRDSRVTFTLTPTDGGTRVELVHENVDPADYERTSEGWRLFYVGAIQKLLEGTDGQTEPEPGKPSTPTRKPRNNGKKPTRKPGRSETAVKGTTRKGVAKRGIVKKGAPKKGTTTKGKVRKGNKNKT